MQAISASLFGALILTLSAQGMAATISPPLPPPGQTTTVVNGSGQPIPMGVQSADGNSVVPVSPTTPIPIGTLGADGSVKPVSPTTPIPIGTVNPNGSVVPVSPTTPIPVSVNVTTTNPLPVTVTGTSTSPVTVTNPPLQPMQYSADMAITADGGFGFGSPIFHVPAGKRFVMEFISLAVSLPAGQKVLFTRLSNNDDEHGFPQHEYYLLGATQDLGSNGVTYFVNQQVKIYVEPGRGFDFDGQRSSLSGEGFGHVAVSGYLVDVP